MTAACPACVALPEADVAPSAGAMQFSLPTIHCAACIQKIERGLAKVRGVRAARVNLSLKRLSVDGGIAPDAILKAVTDLGFEIYALDAAALEMATDKAGRDLLMRLAVAGFAMMNVMLLSVAVWSGAEGATRDVFHLISAAIAVPVVAYSGQPFFRNAIISLRVGRLNMDVPISLAIILATGMSLFESLQGGEHAYFDAAVSLTFFLLIGRYLDHHTRSAARSAAKELTALEVHTCTRIKNDAHETVPTTDIRVGDQLLVPSGARIPVDGALLTDTALLDRSFLTGESEAVDATQGAALQAGEINLGAPITLRATAIGEDTTLRRVASLVETAENGRNSYTALADRAARAYAPVVHLLALFTLLGWWAISGDFRHALNIAIAVLIITCPCALGLAVPAVTTAAISRLFNAGFLVKHATALERLAEVDHIVFDKTGTLSMPTVTVPPSLDEDEQRIALALAQHSNHPLSRALAAALADLKPALLTNVQETPGQGVQAVSTLGRVALGRGGWLQAEFTGLGLQVGDDAAIALPTTETPRGGALEALETIDLPGEIVTGDAQKPAMAFAQLLDLPVLAQATPDDKIERLKHLELEGKHVLMIGDGLNDTAALASAHAAIAPSTALDASRSAADVVLIKDSLAGLPLILAVAHATRRLSQQNFGIATAYNIVAVPLAVAGFATPLAAALSMSISSITVLLNAQRIRKVT